MPCTSTQRGREGTMIWLPDKRELVIGAGAGPSRNVSQGSSENPEELMPQDRPRHPERMHDVDELAEMRNSRRARPIMPGLKYPGITGYGGARLSTKVNGLDSPLSGLLRYGCAIYLGP